MIDLSIQLHNLGTCAQILNIIYFHQLLDKNRGGEDCHNPPCGAVWQAISNQLWAVLTHLKSASQPMSQSKFLSLIITNNSTVSQIVEQEETTNNWRCQSLQVSLQHFWLSSIHVVHHEDGEWEDVLGVAVCPLCPLKCFWLLHLHYDCIY